MLNKIKFSYREADKQEGLFTPNHTLFKCKIKVDGLQYTFPYQCNTAYKEPNLCDCMYAIISDINDADPFMQVHDMTTQKQIDKIIAHRVMREPEPILICSYRPVSTEKYFPSR